MLKDDGGVFDMRTFVFLLCTLPSLCYSYNFVGHIVIAESAFQMLDKPRQKRLVILGNVIYKTGGKAVQKKLDSYGDVSSFSKTAFLPGAMTQRKLKSIYRNFGGTYPSSLWSKKNKTGANWHYINYQLDQHNKCNAQFVKKNDNVEWALDKLIRGYTSARYDSSRAVTLAFIAHLVADAHQPLHAVSMDLDPDPGVCKGDRAGKLFCLSDERKNGSCKEEHQLHRYWDYSGYRIDDKSQFQKYVDLIVSEAQKIGDSSVSMEIGDWTKESHVLAAKAYATPRNVWPSDAYQEMTYNESVARMALAALRLKMLIEELL